MMYDGHYQRTGQKGAQVILGAEEKQQIRQTGGLEHAACLQSVSGNSRRGPRWVKSPPIARDYYLSSPLLFVPAWLKHAAHSFSLNCIPNNGLTYVPLINTSADKSASHTSILV